MQTDSHPELQAEVQEFYDWYLVNTDEVRTVRDVLTERPQVLDSALRVLLEADQKCTEESKEVCKLDFDPIANTQDVCALYRVGESRQVPEAFEFPVYQHCEAIQDTSLRLTAIVSPRDSGWVFVDFEYPGGQRLKTMLRGASH